MPSKHRESTGHQVKAILLVTILAPKSLCAHPKNKSYKAKKKKRERLKERNSSVFTFG
jgi:hypothetical protein